MQTKLPALLTAHIGPDRLFPSNREFASAADVSEYTVRAALKGKHIARLGTLRKFADALGMSFGEFERRAGIIADENHYDLDPLDAAILRLLRKLTSEEKKLAIELLRRLGDD